MTAQRAIWLSRDSNGDGTTPKDARLAVGGMLAHDGDSALGVREGVIWDGQDAVVSGRSDMSYDVRALVAVLCPTPSNGALVIANDATVNVSTDAAPGSGSRIDVVWLQQDLTTADGGAESANDVVIGVTQGSASGSPSAPSIPAGALALAHATISASMTGTDEAVIERKHAWTASAGGVLRVESDTERDAISLEGTVVYNAGAGQHQALVDGSWLPVGGEPGLQVRGGVVRISPVAQQVTFEAVVFDPPFTDVDSIAVTVTARSGSTNVVNTAYDNVTINGCDVGLNRTNTTSTDVSWIAVGI